MVHWLLHDAGAKPNPIDRFGRTPLEDAVGAPALLCHHLLLLVHVVVAPLWLCWHGAHMTTHCGWCTATDPLSMLCKVCTRKSPRVDECKRSLRCCHGAGAGGPRGGGEPAGDVGRQGARHQRRPHRPAGHAAVQVRPRKHVGGCRDRPQPDDRCMQGCAGQRNAIACLQ